jgi:tetratricopeptide (TPR) repeat protein
LRKLGLALVLAAVAAFILHAYELRHTMDDAYISLVYARNLVEGQGLVFVPGERVEGYSNFTWTLLLALLMKLGLPPIAVSRWLGVGFAAAAIGITARWARALSGERRTAPGGRGPAGREAARWGPAAVGTAALMASSSALAYWSPSGLETGLFVFLVAAAFERGLAPDVGPGGRLLAPVLFSIATMTRPDAPLLFALWYAWRMVDTVTGSGPARDGRGVKGLVVDAALFLGPLVPYALWKLSYYGDLLPNTYHAKAGVSAVYFARGIDYAVAYFDRFGAWGLAPALALGSLLSRRRRRFCASLLVLGVVYAGYVVAIGGDVLPVHRFWVPLLPMTSILIAAGAQEVVARLPGMGAGNEDRNRSHGSTAAVAAGIALPVAVALVGYLAHRDQVREKRDVAQRYVELMEDFGVWLDERLPPGEGISTTTIGAVAYTSRRPVLDMLGLTDAEIARHPEFVAGLTDTWKEKKYNAASVLRRRPGAIFFSTGVRPSSNAEKALFLYEDFHRSYFPISFRTDPTTFGTETVYLRRIDAPDPPADLGPAEDHRFLDEFVEGLFRQGRSAPEREEAARRFERAASLAPESFTGAAAWEAALKYELGRPDAVARLETVVARDSLALRAVGPLAYHRLSSGDVDGAEELFLHYARVNSDDPVPWEGLARVAWARGDREGAITLSEKSLALWSTNAGALVFLGNLRLLGGELDRADAAYRRALAIEPSLEAARRGRQLVDRERGR